MFDLDNEIRHWRQDLLSSSFIKEEDAEELEDHLLCIFEEAREKGLDDKSAFKCATVKIGLTNLLGNEYLKIGFIERLRRLPTVLVVVAIMMATSGLIDLPPFILGLVNGDLLAAVGDSIEILVPLVIAFKLVCLSNGWRRFTLFLSYLFALPVLLNSVFLTILVLQLDTEGFALPPTYLDLDPQITLYIYYPFFVFMAFFTIWSIYILSRSDIKLLFDGNLSGSINNNKA